jgi:hypothetical protein
MSFKRYFLRAHRFRSSFYHLVSTLFVLTTFLWFFNLISDDTSFCISLVLFFTDYLAMMFDPHPKNMGSWFERYFHRAFDDKTNDEEDT